MQLAPSPTSLRAAETPAVSLVWSSSCSIVTVWSAPASSIAVLIWSTARSAAFWPGGPKSARSPVSGMRSPIVRSSEVSPPPPLSLLLSSESSPQAAIPIDKPATNSVTKTSLILDMNAPLSERQTGVRLRPLLHSYQDRRTRAICGGGSLRKSRGAQAELLGACCAADPDPAPLRDLAVLDHERGLRAVARALTAGAGAGALGEPEGRDDEVTLLDRLRQDRAAGQRCVEDAGVGVVADPDQLRPVLRHAWEREVPGRAIDVAASQRPRPGVDHAHVGRRGAAGNRPRRLRRGPDLGFLLLAAGAERDGRERGDGERGEANRAHARSILTPAPSPLDRSAHLYEHVFDYR